MGASYLPIQDSFHLRWHASSSLRAPYAALCSIFGGPGETQLDLGNYHHAWLLRAADQDDLTFLVHDSRDDGTRAQNRADTRYVWHVDAPDETTLREFCGWLSRAVIAYWSEQPRAKRLTPSSLERVNQLIREGRSTSEAMSQAAEWESAPEAGDFGWPLSE